MRDRSEATKLGHLNRGVRFYPECISCGSIYEIKPSMVGVITCCSRQCRLKIKSEIASLKMRMPARPGSLHHNWKGGITPESKSLRNKFYNQYAPIVRDRDNNSCTKCGLKKESLHVHHIKSWKKYPDLRFDLKNTTTLCDSCHYEITWGKEKPEGMLFGRNALSLAGGVS